MREPPRRAWGADGEGTGRPHDVELDVGLMVRDASRSWIGPTPVALQARWAAAGTRVERQPRFSPALKQAAVVVGFTVAVFGSTTLVATVTAPGASVASVVNLVAHVLTGGAEPPAGEVPVTPSPSDGHGLVPAASGGAPSTAPASRSREIPGASDRWDHRGVPASPRPASSPALPHE